MKLRIKTSSEGNCQEMIKIDVRLKIEYTDADLRAAISDRLPVTADEIKDFHIIKRTLNVSDKSNPHYTATVAVSFDSERETGLLKMRKKVSPYDPEQLMLPPSRLSTRPIVVGAGPAGLFAALALALAGARPIILERGLPVEERSRRVELFSSLGILDTECNVQYGEGGAGTYSDGKLKVGSKDKYKSFVLSEFILAGAEPDIMYSTSAHLGTDRLPIIVRHLREKIIAHGGEIYFSTRVTDLITRDGRIIGVGAERDGTRLEFDTDVLIMATGHSARDSFELLLRVGAVLRPRPFGVGVRIEHPREYINTLVYGKNYNPALPTASYHLVTHLPTGRSVYSFCMCPGGTVVPAASDEGGIVTNGMSEYLRDGNNSNAAFLVSLKPEDFPTDHPLAGVDLQREIERTAYRATGSYKAPSQPLGELVENISVTEYDRVQPSYPLGTEHITAEEYLPETVVASLRAAILDFDLWMPGFYYPSAAVTGPETRSTSPVTVLRGDNLQATGVSGLYPVGEGAGYSGGIISSARDGVVAAERILLEAHEKTNI